MSLDVILIAAPEGESLAGLLEAFRKHPNMLGNPEQVVMDEHGRLVETYATRAMAERARSAWENLGYVVL